MYAQLSTQLVVLRGYRRICWHRNCYSKNLAVLDARKTRHWRISPCLNRLCAVLLFGLVSSFFVGTEIATCQLCQICVGKGVLAETGFFYHPSLGLSAKTVCRSYLQQYDFFYVFACVRTSPKALSSADFCGVECTFFATRSSLT